MAIFSVWILITLLPAVSSQNSSIITPPIVTSVHPMNTIPSGGIRLNFTGENLNSVMSQAMLEIHLQPLRSTCQTQGNSIISCVMPSLTEALLADLNYTLILDGDRLSTQDKLPISIKSDPVPIDPCFRRARLENHTLITIPGQHFDSVRKSEITVNIGSQGKECIELEVTATALICTAPAEISTIAYVDVTIGTNITLNFRCSVFEGPISTTIGIALGIVLGILLICVTPVVCSCCCVRCIVSKKEKAFRMAESERSTYELAMCNREEFESNMIMWMEEMTKTIPESLKVLSSNLKLSKSPLGQGEFGIVYKGILANWNDVPLQGVAVKTLKGLYSPADVQSMVDEITMMQELCHPHVMPLIGVCLDAGPGVSIVMPFMVNGSLLNYVKRERNNLELDDDSEIDQILSVRKLMLKICHQITLGMTYLVEQKFVHRDLAARNCMLDVNGDIKVGDFGMAEDVYQSGYFRQTEKKDMKLPYKWMALESLDDSIFTEKTDVWSYGVTVWEVFSCGRTPYPAVDPLSLITLLREGQRLERPLNAACAIEISVLMRKCWREDPDERPSFSELSSIVERLLMSIAGYTEFEMVLPDNSEDLLEYHYVTDNQRFMPKSPSTDHEPQPLDSSNDVTLSEEEIIHIVENTAYARTGEEDYYY